MIITNDDVARKTASPSAGMYPHLLTLSLTILMTVSFATRLKRLPGTLYWIARDSGQGERLCLVASSQLMYGTSNIVLGKSRDPLMVRALVYPTNVLGITVSFG